MPQSFETLQKNIKQHLSQSLRRREIKPRDLLILLTILSKSETYDELHTLIELFKGDYPALSDMLSEEKLDIKTNFEHLVQEFIARIIADNPLLAAEISKTALTKGKSLEDIKTQFPEFKAFVEAQQK